MPTTRPDVASPTAGHRLFRAERLPTASSRYLSAFDDRIDALEDDILKAPTEAQLGELFGMKRTLMEMRKVVAPQRDMMSQHQRGLCPTSRA